ncbi:hypothetical protein [Granulibacter bethesdensis]|uniref:Uncharacterized protein n=1 Tax=Granulibacter bethesdensis (strain ATCC BAA-1260 / CGDNIH1) TaxID=391165 RepID=Q0BQU5_GRABC|nr:hypothetical protein [Granulibacter bethesdensis]ABI62807.1 Hypothetical protein GbCGDNIH1_1909 [Granulibacter bethesdensis CGDNIH1]AHJ68243.1 Hypothetical protein GbCGDNIH2_1909 [Granulibacter bethesdensis]APH52670.1 Hypothetical protein GbCGDNIH5_1909 [Granulibacter bethesdensis]APH65360.1 Hypothetical protein GbCGDNIH1I4_1909 [Granulibacter bethesdensis]
MIISIETGDSIPAITLAPMKRSGRGYRMLWFGGLIGLGLIITAGGSAIAAGKAMRFWNTTSDTIVKLQMAPVGTTAWGSDQCKNDKDGEVEADERLKILGIQPGRYDVKLKLKRGRSCVVHDVEAKEDGPYAFAIGDADLKDCSP